MLALLLTSSQVFAQTLVIAPPAGTYIDVQGASVTGFSFTVTGGTAPYTWVVASGTFVPGNVLNSDGSVTGTNTTAGTYTYTIRVTDKNGLTATAAYTDIITAAVPTMPEWMMLLMAGALIAIAVRSFRKPQQLV